MSDFFYALYFIFYYFPKFDLFSFDIILIYEKDLNIFFLRELLSLEMKLIKMKNLRTIIAK